MQIQLQQSVYKARSIVLAYVALFLLNESTLNAQYLNYEPSRFRANVRVLYPTTLFTLNTVPTTSASIGLEYDLSRLFFMQLDYNSGYFKSEKAQRVNNNDLKYVKSFTNDYDYTRLKLAFKLNELFSENARFKYSIMAGSGYYSCVVNSINNANELRGFDKKFFTISGGAELSYLLNHYWSLTFNAEYTFSQTYYLDNQLSDVHDNFIYTGIGLKYTIHKQSGKAIHQSSVETDADASRESNSGHIREQYSTLSNGIVYTGLDVKVDSIIYKVDSVLFLLDKAMDVGGTFDDSSNVGTGFMKKRTVQRLPIVGGSKYNVVVGTFSVYDVNRGVSMVQRSSDDLYLLSGRKSSTKIRVAIFSTNSYKDALTYLSFCRNKIGYKDAWIYKK